MDDIKKYVVRWECNLCEEDDPCVLVYDIDQEIFAVSCPFDNGSPDWKKVKGDRSDH
jgi:hypothetical protein